MDLDPARELARLEAKRAARHAPRYGWIVALLAVLAAGIVGRYVAFGGGRRAAPHEPAEEVDTADYLGPIETAVDPRTGEETAPFAGFAISVETDPPDALVTVDGVERGESPVVVGLECASGAEVRIRARKAGAGAARASTRCRADTLVKLTLRLE